jgi:uncharacterized protein YbaP (TraB family)
MPRSFLVLSGLLLLLGALMSSAGAGDEVTPTEKPFLWMIDTSPPSFMYGTIHLPDDRVLALPYVVQAAFDVADVVLTEVPMDDQTKMKAAQSFMMNGQTLTDVLPQELYARVDEFMQAKGLSLAMLGQFKPIAIAVQLILLDYLPDLMTKKAPDALIYDMAGKAGKKTDALETIEEQIAVFDALTMDEQIEALRSVVEYLEEAEESGISIAREIVDIYLTGDAEKMWEILTAQMDPDDPVDKKFMRLLFAERNKRMTDRIISRIEQHPGEIHFFAVGAGHYHRDDGILALLKEAGYGVKRLDAGDVEIIEEALPAAAGSNR